MNDEVEMHTVEERFPTLEGRTMFRGRASCWKVSWPSAVHWP